MRRAMKDDMGTLILKNLSDAGGVADVGHMGNHHRPEPALANFAVNLEKVVFRLFQQDQPGGAESHDLPADLRSDRPAGAGDKHDFAGDEPLQFGRVEIDRLSPEQGMDIDLSRWAHGLATSDPSSNG
jgi:hypothetical protein